MEKLNQTDDGHWRLGEKVLDPGTPIEIEFEGTWIHGRMEANQTLGDIFVACDGQVHVTDLDGAAARFPRGSAQENFDAALNDFLCIAGEAAVMLRMVAQSTDRQGRRPERTYSKLFAAIYRVRQSRAQLGGSAAATV